MKLIKIIISILFFFFFCKNYIYQSRATIIIHMELALRENEIVVTIIFLTTLQFKYHLALVL